MCLMSEEHKPPASGLPTSRGSQRGRGLPVGVWAREREEVFDEHLVERTCRTASNTSRPASQNSRAAFITSRLASNTSEQPSKLLN